MSVRKIEALLDAIANYHGANDPDCEAYRLRNPLMIKSFALPGKHVTDEQGRRVFDSYSNGYRAGLFDLEIKLSGNSRARLAPTDLLENLLRVYGIREAGFSGIVSFLRRALADQSISKSTPVEYFVDRPKQE